MKYTMLVCVAFAIIYTSNATFRRKRPNKHNGGLFGTGIDLADAFDGLLRYAPAFYDVVPKFYKNLLGGGSKHRNHGYGNHGYNKHGYGNHGGYGYGGHKHGHHDNKHGGPLLDYGHHDHNDVNYPSYYYNNDLSSSLYSHHPGSLTGGYPIPHHYSDDYLTHNNYYGNHDELLNSIHDNHHLHEEFPFLSNFHHGDGGDIDLLHYL